LREVKWNCGFRELKRQAVKICSPLKIIYNKPLIQINMIFLFDYSHFS